jgi:hypothetical protein
MIQVQVSQQDVDAVKAFRDSGAEPADAGPRV